MNVTAYPQTPRKIVQLNLSYESAFKMVEFLYQHLLFTDADVATGKLHKAEVDSGTDTRAWEYAGRARKVRADKGRFFFVPKSSTEQDLHWAIDVDQKRSDLKREAHLYWYELLAPSAKNLDWMKIHASIGYAKTPFASCQLVYDDTKLGDHISGIYVPSKEAYKQILDFLVWEVLHECKVEGFTSSEMGTTEDVLHQDHTINVVEEW